MTVARTSHDPPLTRPATAPPSLLGGSLLVSALAQFSLSADNIWIGHGVRLDPTLNRAIHRMMKRAVKSAMQAISANDLKTGGIGAISRALEHEREVGLSVRGELRFVVMEADAYQRLRECELEIALQEARADLAAGRVVYESVDDHLKRLDAMAIGPDDEVQTSHSQP
jgi:hypothetical protein